MANYNFRKLKSFKIRPEISRVLEETFINLDQMDWLKAEQALDSAENQAMAMSASSMESAEIQRFVLTNKMVVAFGHQRYETVLELFERATGFGFSHQFEEVEQCLIAYRSLRQIGKEVEAEQLREEVSQALSRRAAEIVNLSHSVGEWIADNGTNG